MNKIITILILLIGIESYAGPLFSKKDIFAPDEKKHGHTHASSIIAFSDNSLLACWYEGKSDKSRDVHIQAAWLLPGQQNWSQTFLMADTPMLSDNNPCLFFDDKNQLWLIYYTLLGSPEQAWDTAFLRYKICTNPVAGEKIKWDVENDLAIIPNKLDETMRELYLQYSQKEDMKTDSDLYRDLEFNLKDQLVRKLGWTTRARPVTLSNGNILLPMASETFGIAMMALTPDYGITWIFSEPPFGFGVEQPSVFERKNKQLVAYFRDAGPDHRIRTSVSNDMGLTWSPIQNLSLPNPGSGLEVLRLESGNILLIYNDCENDPRNRLAVALSDDEGVSWKWKRYLEYDDGNERFDYPSVIQTKDGLVHATYSVDVKTIRHAVFNEKWIMNID